VLVQDGARYHTAKETHTWVAAHAERVHVVQLPSYSPDYNPIEHVWRYVKQGTHNASFATFAALHGRVESRLRDLQADPLRGWAHRSGAPQGSSAAASRWVLVV
jgi:transposase